MIEITVKCHSILKRHVKSKDGTLDILVNDNESVESVLDSMGVMKGEIGVILINKKIVNKDEKLKNKDLIEIFPIYGGG